MTGHPAQLTWLNPPPFHESSANTIRIRTADKTDFWRGTFYGFTRESGHFLHTPATGDFSAEVTIRGHYRALYDQAGLMIRIDEHHWIKAGIEYTDGLQHFSTVVTRDQSDWSVIPLAANPDSMRIRLTRHAEAIRIQYQLPGASWQLARLAYFPTADPVLIGPMCCSPERAGFEVEFTDFKLKPAIPRDLHA